MWPHAIHVFCCNYSSLQNKEMNFSFKSWRVIYCVKPILAATSDVTEIDILAAIIGDE